MKASLVLKLGQQLSMTPQLQQAIRLLQLSSLDLQTEIQQALESNPMLELEDASNSIEIKDNTNKAELDRQDENPWSEQIPENLPIDTAWEDIYQTSASNLPVASEDWDYGATTAAIPDLYDHLLWQLNLAPMTDIDRLIATTLIDALDADGYLREPLEDICASFAPELGIELDEVQVVLHRIQHFEPTGVAARNLSECLLLQLNQLPEDTAYLAQAKKLCTQFLDQLGGKDFSLVLRRLKINMDELSAITRLIKTLDPKPGASIGGEEATYIIPDIIVRKEKSRWLVELNPEVMPKLNINSYYQSFIQRADQSDDNLYMRNQLQEAKWFIKSLQSRSETLLKVATTILNVQKGFFEEGPEAMKPLVLAEVAEQLGMHESTISRATTQKYMHTPRGIFELKYFFSSHVNTAEGGEFSSTAIRALIRKLVEKEDPKKPLSDSKIVDLLEEQGIQVARRTIAKYRESLGILSSSERKQRL
ncbi:RNA polymerase factor sigma-54 [Pseudomonas sp. F1_0610]|uniref:RNA polymerase factor sigma-54 n=1 Tax=Pseudomonas sp. F1_0610 TaxID=3114284 RepID=UPI0039C3BBAA